jgi:CHAD domain-containing protein
MAVSVSDIETTYEAQAGQVVLAYLREQRDRLRSLGPRVRADEPDSVHQMRITARRLRAGLRSFDRIVPRAGTATLAAELTWLGRDLGQARDAEVLPAHLLASLNLVPPENVVGPVRARIRGHFAPLTAAARAEVRVVLDSPRYSALLDQLDRLLAEPVLGPDADRPAAEVLPAAVRRAYRRAARRMRRARHIPPGPRRDAALHEARKAVRRARFACEAVAPVLGQDARRFTKRMKRVQSLLGEHQDAVIARAVVRQMGMSAHLARENAFSYGLLHERDTHRRMRLQRRARKAWGKASRRGDRAWMR